MDIRAAEISTILKDQIANFGSEAEIAEVGRFSRSVMVSRVFTVWTKSRQVKCLNSPMVFRGWLLI